MRNNRHAKDGGPLEVVEPNNGGSRLSDLLRSWRHAEPKVDAVFAAHDRRGWYLERKQLLSTRLGCLSRGDTSAHQVVRVMDVVCREHFGHSGNAVAVRGKPAVVTDE